MIDFLKAELKAELEAAAYIVGGIAFLAVGLWISDIFTGGVDAFWRSVTSKQDEEEGRDD